MLNNFKKCLIMKAGYVLAVFVLSSFFLQGCGGKNSKPFSTSFPEETPSYKNVISHYHLQPGDTIDVLFNRTPELNEGVVVRPDGRISLQLIDEVEVAGLTPPQLEMLLKEKYTPYLKTPDATVIISSFAGRKAYVGGQVILPGVIPLLGNTTVTQALFEARGLRADANLSNVIIISRNPDGSPTARKINVKKALKGKIPDSEMLLKPYDMVYVPKSPVVKANEFIYHLYNFIPPNIWFGFRYEVHNEPENRD